MGHLLSHPITSKYANRRGNLTFKVGAAEMQGYRVDMEDAHNIILNCRQFAAANREIDNNPLQSTHEINPYPPVDQPNQATEPPEFAFFGVYDGHCGPACSQWLCRDLPVRIGSLDDPFDTEAVRKAVMASDDTFCEHQAVRQHGSTACFAVVQPQTVEQGQQRKYKVLVSNVGDSRTLIVGIDGKIRFVTEDHKPENEAESRRIRNAGGTVSFDRVNGQLAMSRAMGDYCYKGKVGLASNAQQVISEPDVTVMECVAGEKIVVVCDGLLERASNEQLIEFVESSLNDKSDPAALACDMLEWSLGRGSKDNMTAMVILLEDGSDYNAEDEYIAGPIAHAETDRNFVETYVAYAKSHGVEPGKCLQMARLQDIKQQSHPANGALDRPLNAGRPNVIRLPAGDVDMDVEGDVL